jgi:hypothetical protein
VPDGRAPPLPAPAKQQQGSLLAAPGGLDPSSTRARGAPIPEKAWAARNVARSLLGGGDPNGVAEAMRMLREAAGDCREYYGPDHPGGSRPDCMAGMRRHGAACGAVPCSRAKFQPIMSKPGPAGQLATLLDLIDADLALLVTSSEPERARRDAADAIHRALSIVQVRV